MLGPLVDSITKDSFMDIYGVVVLASAILSLWLKEAKGLVMKDNAY